MAGTATLTINNVGGGTNVLDCEINWTSDGAGNVNSDALTMPAGTIVLVQFIPGTGTSQPTNLYSVGLLDAHGTSVFGDGAGGIIGGSLSNVNASKSVPFINGATTTYVRSWLLGPSGGNPYQFTVTGAGATKSGTLNVIVSPTAI